MKRVNVLRVDVMGCLTAILLWIDHVYTFTRLHIFQKHSRQEM